MLTQQRLKEVLHYDKESGVFIWIKKPNARANRVKVGSVAGVKSHEYLSVQIDKKAYGLHRLAWLYIYGEMPNIIDHKNHNTSDNRIDNLRNTSQKVNCENRLIRSDCISGACGVSFAKDRNRWNSYINVDGKRISLGYFTEFHEAVNARKNAEVLYGYHENHGKTLEEIQGAEYE